MSSNSICVIGNTEKNQENIEFLQNIGIFIKTLNVDFVKCKINHDESLNLNVEYYDIFTNSPMNIDEIYIVGYIFIPGGFPELSLQLKELRKHEEKDLEMKPIILTPKLYWEPLIEQTFKAIQEGFTPNSIFDKIYRVNSLDNEEIKIILINMINNRNI